MIRDCVFGIWYSVIAEFCSAGIWDSDIRDRDQDRVPGFGMGYIRDIGTAGYIRDGSFANKPSRIYPAVPKSRIIYPILNPGTRS